MSQMPLSGLPDNVWMGISTENQQRFDERIGYLYGFEATVKYLSVEPMLGSLTLGKHSRVIDWTIAGGESGSKARPTNPKWFRNLRDECVESNIPYFFKQWGEFAPSEMFSNMQAKLFHEFEPPELPPNSESVEDMFDHYLSQKSVPLSSYPMVRPGKKKAGNLLDGEKWEQFPKYVRREAI